MKSTLDVQILALYLLSYINTVNWIGGNVAVHMRKVNYKVRRLSQSATEHR